MCHKSGGIQLDCSLLVTVYRYVLFCMQQAAERCVTTLLELIQTKVNYVVQEAIVVIKVGMLH